MRKLAVRLHRSAGDAVTVGTLAAQDRRVFFEYDAAFLGRGIELSPFKLRTQPGLIAHTDHAFGPLFGVFDDSLPDGWGLLLMDRHFRRRGIDPRSVSPLDRLAYLGTRTMGALTYHPPAHEDPGGEAQPLDLDALGSNAEAVVEGDAAEVLPELMRAGGSPGGARPKVLVGIQGDHIVSGEDALPDGYEHWIVKFSARADGREAGAVEYAYSLMARAAGIDIPPTRLFEVGHGRRRRRFFGVRRFDRADADRRIHMHTFANLIHTNFRIPATDYADVFKVTQALSRNHADMVRAFRLMLFNVVAHNRDDHAKNFAFLLDDRTGEWSLAPAYDLTYSPGPGGEHSSTVLGEGRRPLRSHCLKLAEQFGLKPRETSPIIDQVNAAVSRWPAFAEEAHCPKKIAAAIGACFHHG
jgi:serine/threonine-protein kinase HipA